MVVVRCEYGYNALTNIKKSVDKKDEGVYSKDKI